jgi:hypothetical protein
VCAAVRCRRICPIAFDDILPVAPHGRRHPPDLLRANLLNMIVISFAHQEDETFPSQFVIRRVVIGIE